MSLLRSAARRLGLGKYKYWRGQDLQGNNFFERPHETYPGEWRKNKRYVEYQEARPLSDYDFRSIPVQWSAWLRRTRQEPPTLQELEQDYTRQLRLQDNVARLAVEYQEERLRLNTANEAALPSDEPGPHASVGEAVAANGGEGLAPQQQAGLPQQGGGLESDGRAAQVAREIGNGNVQGDRLVPKSETPEEAAERRRVEERQEAIKRREEFARQNASVPRGNPSDSHQPGGWSPSAPARRKS
ncbi:hypothetical protein JCM11641_006094 [Rhodosporidiobolus odoratus]